MSNSTHVGPPGIGNTRATAPRHIRRGTDHRVLFPGGVTLDGSESRDTTNTGYLDTLQAGTVLGKVTATGKYAPSYIGVLPSAHTNGTSLTIGAVAATELLRRVGATGTASFRMVGPVSTAAGTIVTTNVTHSAIDTSTGVVTITATGANKAAGTLLQVVDGSETPLGIIDDGWGHKVTDINGTDVDPLLEELLIGGVIDASQLPFWSSMDTDVQAWLKAVLNGKLPVSGVIATLITPGVGRFIFDDAF